MALHRAACFVPQGRWRVIFVASLQGCPLPSFVRPLHVPARGRVPVINKECGLAHAFLEGRGGILPPLVMRDAASDLPDPLHTVPSSTVSEICSLCCSTKKLKCQPLHDSEVKYLVNVGLLTENGVEKVKPFFNFIFFFASICPQRFACKPCRRLSVLPYLTDFDDALQ